MMYSGSNGGGCVGVYIWLAVGLYVEQVEGMGENFEEVICVHEVEPGIGSDQAPAGLALNGVEAGIFLLYCASSGGQ